MVDPFVIDKQLDRYRQGSRRLSALCTHYGVRLDAAHSADADALAAAQVAWRQAGVYAALGAMSLDELHAEQVVWAAGQAMSLQEYLRRTKDPAAVVELAWPLVPYTAEAVTS